MLADIRARDERDSARDVAPLKPGDGRRSCSTPASWTSSEAIAEALRLVEDAARAERLSRARLRRRIFTSPRHSALAGGKTVDGRLSKAEQGRPHRGQPSSSRHARRLRRCCCSSPLGSQSSPRPFSGVACPDSTSTLRVALPAQYRDHPVRLAPVEGLARRRSTLMRLAERLATQRQHRPDDRPRQPPRADARARPTRLGDKRTAVFLAPRPRSFQAGQRPPRPSRRRQGAAATSREIVANKVAADGSLLRPHRRRRIRGPAAPQIGRRRSREAVSQDHSRASPNPWSSDGAQVQVIRVDRHLRASSAAMTPRVRCARATSRSMPPSAAGRNACAWFDEELEREICRTAEARRGNPHAASRPASSFPSIQPLVDLEQPPDHRLRGARAVALAGPRLARGRKPSSKPPSAPG